MSNPPQNFEEDTLYEEFGRCHNIFINEDTGYAYAVGTQTYNGGPHFIDISDPTNPTPAGGYSDDSYSHDVQVVTYSGPDTEHLGKEIMIGSNENEIAIVDITNKNNPNSLSTISYSNVAYTHQGWFTEDQRYFIVGDEIDELNVGFNTRTIILDFEDLDNPSFHFEYEGPTEAIDHNGYVVGDKYYLSNYRAGMRVLDISQIGNENITEVGFFDTYPDSDSANFNGAWNVYPFFASGNIVISDIDSGFFLVRDPSLGAADVTLIDFEIAPNPAKENITITATSEPIESIEIFNILGQRVLNLVFDATPSKNINITSLIGGMYLIKINEETTKRLIVK